MALAVRAELLDLQAIRIVAPVLLGDVVAVLALFARQRDLRANVCRFRGHCRRPLSASRNGGQMPLFQYLLLIRAAVVKRIVAAVRIGNLFRS
jgi:hypothetical protein